MEIIVRKKAAEAGLVHYFTGRPCKHGHISRRIVSNGGCCECKIEKYNDPRKKAVDKLYRLKNIDRKRKRDAEYYTRTKRRTERSDRLSPENMKLGHERRRIKMLEYGRLYKFKNKDRRRYESKYRKKRAKIATPPWVKFPDMIMIYAKAGENDHVDHIIPITHDLICGLNVPTNLQVIPAAHNLSKHNWFDPDECVFNKKISQFIRVPSPKAPDYDFIMSA